MRSFVLYQYLYQSMGLSWAGCLESQAVGQPRSGRIRDRRTNATPTIRVEVRRDRQREWHRFATEDEARRGIVTGLDGPQ